MIKTKEGNKKNKHLSNDLIARTAKDIIQITIRQIELIIIKLSYVLTSNNNKLNKSGGQLTYVIFNNSLAK